MTPADRENHLRTTLLAVFSTIMTARPNCTAYLIWHYLTRDEYRLAADEFRIDGDKIPGYELPAGVTKRDLATKLEELFVLRYRI